MTLLYKILINSNTMNSIKKSIPALVFIAGVILLGVSIFIIGEKSSTDANSNNNEEQVQNIEAKDVGITTFQKEEGAEICLEDGKPVVYLFSTTYCPHCTWAKDAFDQAVKEYVDEGRIKAYHWELDINDNTLTDEAETEVPEEHIQKFLSFNPEGYVPAFYFGCKYYRVGTGHERTNDISSEKGEFITVIEELLNSL